MSSYEIGQHVMYRDWGWYSSDHGNGSKTWGVIWKRVTVVKVTAKRLKIRFRDGWEQLCNPEVSIRPITTIVPVGERRHHDVVWTAPNPTFAPAAPSDAITGDCIRLLGFCPVMNDDPCMYGKCGNMDLKVPVPVEKPLQKDDRVRVTYGAYTGNTGTITAITRFKKRPELSFCVISWDDQRPASSYKLWMVERVTEEPVKNSAQIMPEVVQPAVPLPINCHQCGQPVGREVVIADDKHLCAKCGAIKLRTNPQMPEVAASEAQVEEKPAPRKIEQPKQKQIPMVQLPLF